jgi:cytochrome c oxidase cbb3-type subunit 2
VIVIAEDEQSGRPAETMLLDRAGSQSAGQVEGLLRRPLARPLIAWILLSAPLLWATPTLAQAPETGPQGETRGEARRLYNNACAPCHGVRGDGEGPAARQLGSPQPRDFTAAVFKFRSRPTGYLPTDEDLFRVISKGVPGTWMPAWERLLSEEQRSSLVRFIKGFSDLFNEEAEAPSATITAPGYSAELVREGRFVYQVLNCWQCHGMDGRGGGPSADRLTDYKDRQIRPYDFTRGRPKSAHYLYSTLATGLDGTPMPAYETEALAFPGGRDADLNRVEEGLGQEADDELKNYLAGQPSPEQLAAMSEEALDLLVQGRRWAVVYYVQSIGRGKDALYWLFADDPEAQEP